MQKKTVIVTACAKPTGNDISENLAGDAVHRNEVEEKKTMKIIVAAVGGTLIIYALFAFAVLAWS